VEDSPRLERGRALLSAYTEEETKMGRIRKSFLEDID
jgi:hypothetical protein